MAKIGDAPVAARYDGIATGPKFAYLFETQAGLPVDGTSALLRDMSPFTLRLLPPDALLDAAAATGATGASTTVGSGEASVDLIEQAALGAATGGVANDVADALKTVTVGGTGDVTAQLESFVAAGKFYTTNDSQSVSMLADAFTAADIALQLRKILDAEPLVLLVNPSEMNVQYTKVQTYQTKTRYGYVFEAWGEEQPSISFSGSTAGFVAGAASTSSPMGAQETGEASSVSGYQAAARRDSAAWQNFAALYHFYRNNGYIYDTISGSEAHLFVGSVAIDYDQWTYVGHIETFSYRFEEESPLRVTFDMDFKVSRMYDRHVSSQVVVPLTSPTQSPTWSNSGATRQGTALNTRQADTALQDFGDAVSQTPLDLLGGGF